MSQNFLPFLADRVLNRPLLIHPAKAEIIYGVLEGRITLGGSDMADLAPQPEASRFKGGYTRPDGKSTRWTRVAGNTALISVIGSLVNRGAWIGANSGLTSYEGLAAQIDEIAGERSISNVVFDIDSYGGEATGMAALAAKIRNLRQTKKVVAVVNDVAASAGYGIASGAKEIVISPTSIVGSIGVVMMHLDRSVEMQAKGIRPTLIHAGAKKVDGNPFGPLPDSVRADMQKDVLAFYDQFLETVEAGRGKRRLSAEKARKTEADVFIGQDAIKAGLADRMASLDDILAELSRPVRAAGTSQKRRTATMGLDDLPAADAGQMHTDTALRAAVQKAEADGKAVGITEGKAEGRKEGVSAERERIAAILNSEEAKDRPNAARKLALAPENFSAETATALLADMPKEAAPKGEGDDKGGKPDDVASLEQRATGTVEIGAGKQAGNIDAEAAQAGWAKAVASINSRR